MFRPSIQRFAEFTDGIQVNLLRALIFLFVAELTASAGPLDLLFNQQRFIITNGMPCALVGEGTNLFVGLNTSNRFVLVQRLATNGTAGGAPIVLSTNGAGPLLSGNSSGLLAVWMETGALMVKSIAPATGTSSAPMPINTGDAIPTLHAVAGDTHHAAVVWTTESSPGTDLLWLTLVEQSIPNVSVLLQSNAPIRFPDVTATTNGFLIAWTEQINSSDPFWAVRACAANAAGQMLAPPATISSANASNAYPIAIHWTGTNALVAWTREVGPFPYGNPPDPTTNAFLPMIRARFVSAEGTPINDEFEVGRARGAQIHPKIAFDGTNYLVAWFDSRVVDGNAPALPSLDAWQLYAQQIAPNGTKPQREMRFGRNQSAHVASNAFSLIFSGSRFVAAFALENGMAAGDFLGTAPSIPARLTDLVRSDPYHWLMTLTGGSQRPYTLQVSTNFTHWLTYSSGGFVNLTFKPGRLFVNDYFFNDAGNIVYLRDLPGPFYFRTYFSSYDCISNLRNIHWAKTQWALENNKHPNNYAGQVADYGDLFGPGKYLPVQPTCPSHGTYSIGANYAVPACSIHLFQIWDAP